MHNAEYVFFERKNVGNAGSGGYRESHGFQERSDYDRYMPVNCV